MYSKREDVSQTLVTLLDPGVEGANRRKPKAQRLALIALSSSPDNYCTHVQKNLMRRLQLKADVPHGETFGSATSFTVLFAPTQFMRTSCTHEIGTLRMNFGSATSLAVLFYIRATR